MLKTKTLLTAAVSFALLATSAHAAVLATYDFTGLAGTESSKAANSAVSTVTAGAITRGAGLTGTAAGNSLNSTNWSTTGTFSAGSTSYYTVSIAPTAGNTLDLASLVVGLRRSNTGPVTFDLRSSADNYAATLGTIAGPTSVAAPFTFNLGSAFDALTSTTTFRIYGYGAGAAGGTGRVENGTGGAGLVFNGTTNAAGPSNSDPVVTAPPTTTVTFGTVVSTPAPYSVQVTATDANAADILSLTAGTLPAGVTVNSITGSGTSPATFTVTGTVAYSLSGGPNVTIPFNVTDGTSTVGSSFALSVVPEPTSLAALAGAMVVGLRRRGR